MSSGYALPQDKGQQHFDKAAQGLAHARANGLGIRGAASTSNGPSRATTPAPDCHHHNHVNGKLVIGKSRVDMADGESSLVSNLEELSAQQRMGSMTPDPVDADKDKFLLITELYTALLIVLPCCLTALATQTTTKPLSSGKPHNDSSDIRRLQEQVLVASSPVFGWTESLAVVQLIAGMALIAFGLSTGVLPSARLPPVSGYASPRMPTNTNKNKSSSKSSFTTRLRAAVLLGLSVGLPLLAATQLGGWRVGLILLSAYTIGLMGLQKPTKTAEPSRAYYVFAAFALAGIADLLCLTSAGSIVDTLLAYTALAVTAFLLPSPYIAKTKQKPAFRHRQVTPMSPPAISWSTVPQIRQISNMQQRDEFTSLLAGLLLLGGGIATVTVLDSPPQLSHTQIVAALAAAAVLALSLQYSRTRSLQSNTGVGFLAGALSLMITGMITIRADTLVSTICNSLLTSLHIAAVMSSTVSRRSRPKSKSGQQHNTERGSAITVYLLSHTVSGSLIHSILQEKDSRRIAYFTCLNFGFMLVQGLYGYLSGSLGLLSDTVHMFFDCLGLIVGLGAAIASRWPPSRDRPFGWGKLNTLAGFGNGVFLMLVSVEFVWEAIEGILEGRELRRVKELFVVSTLGLLVNLVGLFAFGHAHAGHDHGHSHSHDGHDHGHNENMHGIFLHVAADAGGSLAVIVSTALTLWNPWYLWDPVATIIIAILIFAAAVPLVVSSGQKLLLIVPEETEYIIKAFLQEVGEIRGVLAYSEARFWMIDGGDAHDHCGHEHQAHHHSHGHEHEHDHKNESCGHDHNMHKHPHAHDHEHEHEHKHEHAQPHDHDHAHSHDHPHGHSHEKHAVISMTGSLHVTIVPQTSLEDVRERINDAALAKGMQLTIQVQYADASLETAI